MDLLSRESEKPMKLLEAKEGYVNAFRAAGNSKSTGMLYSGVIENLAKFLNNPELSKISLGELERYMVYLQDEYKPKRKNNDTSPLSSNSLRNHWKAIKSFFKFCVDPHRGLLSKNPTNGLKCPPKNTKAVHPLSIKEVEELLKNAYYANPSAPSNRKEFVMRRRTALRDIAMIFVLLDTGMRVGELCRLRLVDFNRKDNSLFIMEYGKSDRKTKAHTVYLSDITVSALWDYMAKNGLDKEENVFQSLFLTERGVGITTNSVRLLLADLGKKAGIRNVHPHRFRHTFAIEYFRNGGRVNTLQQILGHSDTKMCEVYLKFSKADIEHEQRKFSPVSGLSLKPILHPKQTLKSSCKSTTSRKSLSV